MELARHAGALRARGYGVCSVSYDPVDVLRDFATRRGITYPMLSDPESAIIRAFGLLNEQAQPGTREYGVPHPTILFVDRFGVVMRTYAEEKYYHRKTMATILTEDAEPIDLHITAVVAGAHVTVRTLTAQEDVYPGNRFALFVDVDPQPGVHVYAPGAGPEYHALSLRMHVQTYFSVDAPAYPPADSTWTSPLQEQVPVYTRRARIWFDVALGTRQELQPIYDAGGTLHIEGVLMMQGCSETACWPPDDIPLSWSLRLIPPDLERPPEPLRREALLLRQRGSD